MGAAQQSLSKTRYINAVCAVLGVTATEFPSSESAWAVAKVMDVELKGTTAADYLNKVASAAAGWLQENDHRFPWSASPTPDVRSVGDIMEAVTGWLGGSYFTRTDISPFGNEIIEGGFDAVESMCSGGLGRLAGDDDLLAALGVTHAVEEWSGFDRFLAYTFVTLVCRALERLLTTPFGTEGQNA